eukprot:gnl/MRDRNA2_/MRDRNA2_85153_c0_seq3.p1 gnl/MRDRNA2_/MRDRNA2_85153_c0~~gnl/MRDRNA2_/MRDRNA2_85153_c0_seq3.p1  ORF type:complete len:136 (+),score=10.01 gnl/MRDRNA2_/MRDRNA2_85153_c0_seq3:45-410(+)
MARHSNYDQAGRNMGTRNAPRRGIVNGFQITTKEDISLSLEGLLPRINCIDDRHCCLKHLSMMHVLTTLKNMVKQRCDNSFTPFSYKQCVNCNFMAKEDEESCKECESEFFRLAKPIVMSL